MSKIENPERRDVLVGGLAAIVGSLGLGAITGGLINEANSPQQHVVVTGLDSLNGTKDSIVVVVQWCERKDLADVVRSWTAEGITGISASFDVGARDKIAARFPRFGGPSA